MLPQTTRSGLNDPGIDSRWARFFAPIQTGPGAHPASYKMGTGSFPGVKWSERDVDHPSPSSAKVKEKVELYLYFPSGPSWPVLGWTSLFHISITFKPRHATVIGGGPKDFYTNKYGLWFYLNIVSSIKKQKIQLCVRLVNQYERLVVITLLRKPRSRIKCKVLSWQKPLAFEMMLRYRRDKLEGKSGDTECVSVQYCPNRKPKEQSGD